MFVVSVVASASYQMESTKHQLVTTFPYTVTNMKGSKMQKAAVEITKQRLPSTRSL